MLKKLADMDYISLMSFPGRTGSVIYLHSYLSTMFQISDVFVDKEEVTMLLKINFTMPDEMDETNPQADSAVTEHEICVSEELSSVSKSNMEAVITKVAQLLDAQGISCFRCPKSIYKLYRDIYGMTGQTGIYDVKIYMTGKNTEKGNSLNHTGFCGIINMEEYMYKAGNIIDGT